MSWRAFSIVPFVALALVAASSADVRSEGMARTAPEEVSQAIARAVAERLGNDADVTVLTLQTAIAAPAAVVASPEPGARLGMPARFTLFAAGSRLGSAVATVQATVRHVRASRAIARNEALTAADVVEVDADLRDQPIKRLPVLADVIGARVRRNVAAGEAITAAVIEVPALVKSGDAVSATVRIGTVEAEGKATAQGSGHVGDMIRVVPPGTRRLLKARITGPGTVEIVQ